MKRSQRLKIVLEIAERKESEALKVMQNVRHQLQQEIQRLKEFESYRKDYQDQLSNASSLGISTSQYVNYQNFIAQLGTVLEQQQQKIRLLEQQLNKVTSDWHACHEKTRGMSNHIQDCRDSEQREADAKEQQALDELSQTRNAFRNPS